MRVEQKTAPLANLKIQFSASCIGLTAFDLLQASLWSQNQSRVDLAPLNTSLPCDGILISNKRLVPGNQFKHADRIFFCNGDEPLLVADHQIKTYLGQSHAWLICNALVTDDHPMKSSVIFRSNDLTITRQYWTNAIFPMWHENRSLKLLPKTRHLWAINGANRSWRHHVFVNLVAAVPDLDVHSEISTVIHETNDAWWESEHDSHFRQTVNDMYPITRNHHTSYYDNSIQIAFNSPTTGLPYHGSIPPGYRIMPQYWQSKCVIFPESGWQNCELNITEKIAKCFFAKCVPFPMGGAKINQLYNQLGFFTAWNLLPDSLRIYDDELDHFKRHALMIEAIAYLHDHADLLDSDLAKSFVNANYTNFLTDQSDSVCINQLRSIFSI